MELSDIGYGIGAVVGMILVNIILKIFVPTYLDTTFEKWARRIGCVLLVVVCMLLGGYFGRTELKTGDYSHKTCAEDGCGKPAVSVFRYLFRKAYFCEDHMVLANEFVEPEEQPAPELRDSNGNDQHDAWEMAKRIAIDQMGLPDDSEFTGIDKVRITLSQGTWTVRGDVAVKNEAGKTRWIPFAVSFTFSKSSYNVFSFEFYE